MPTDTLQSGPNRQRSLLDALRDSITARAARRLGLPLGVDSAAQLPSAANLPAAAGMGALPGAVQPPLDSLGRPLPGMSPQPGMNAPPGMSPQPGVNPQPAQMPPAAPSVGAAPRAAFYMLIDCAPAADVEPITRGFYIANYRAADLREVVLYLSADSAGDYMVQLTAHTTDFGGPVAGVARARLRPSGVAGKFVGVKLRFNTVALAPGSTLAFQLELLGGPPGSTLSYALTNDNACPVTLTENTAPPLSNALGRSVAVRITGALP